MSNVGIVKITPELILQLLDYADGGTLRGIRFDGFDDLIEVCIEHPDMPVKLDGLIAMVVDPIYITYTDAFGHSVTLRDRDAEPV